jgi:hypothetical protein
VRLAVIGPLLARRTKPYLPAIAASSLLGFICVRSILSSAGQPALPLDDSFIHLQYAKRLAQGGFFSYVPGEGYTTGATSFLWPLLIAPFWLVGLRGLALVYAVWLLGTLAHAGVAVETARITRRLAGSAAAIGAAAMCLLFGAFAWFAWSGMETVLLAWVLMRAARVAAEHVEPCEPAAPGVRPPAMELIALGLVAPLVRPEGAIASVLAALALALGPEKRLSRHSLRALVPLSGPLLIPLMHFAFAGHATSATASVKWLAASPYLDRGEFWGQFFSNVKLLLFNLLDGEDWTAVFLPENASYAFFFGAIALPVAAFRKRLPAHGIAVAIVVLGTLVPCTYMSLLWNRVRYIWPFAGAWFVLVACFASELGHLARLIRPKVTYVTPLVAGLFAGALSGRLPWAVSDLAQSASAIDRQQVKLGRWAASNLPTDARIGVNDTGAIAYMSGRKTFDVVGLTTEGEAKYWVHGAGSRYEHYEKLPRAKLPTHFIVYPHWMACPPVLGQVLTEATVKDQSILGGATMVAYEARYDVLGSGARPAGASGELVDELDVSDLESERAHGYDLRGASDPDNLVGFDTEKALADGGRARRNADHFTMRSDKAGRARLVVRAGARQNTQLRVRIDGREAGSIEVESSLFVEASLDVEVPSGTFAVQVVSAGAPFSSYHYWLYR